MWCPPPPPQNRDPDICVHLFTQLTRWRHLNPVVVHGPIFLTHRDVVMHVRQTVATMLDSVGSALVLIE